MEVSQGFLTYIYLFYLQTLKENYYHLRSRNIHIRKITVQQVNSE